MSENLIEFITTKGVDLFIGYGTSILSALLVLIIGLWIIKAINKLVKKNLAKLIKEASLVDFLSSLINFTLKIVLFVAIASMLGIQIASLLAILGSIGLAIGLALQGSLSNFAGGLLILVFKPFKKGDFVTIKGIDGYVAQIDLLYTTLTTRLNRVVMIPNSSITNDVVTNHSKEENVRRRFYLDISYEADIAKAKEAMYEAILSTPHILHDPRPFLEVSDFRNNAITFRIFIWCKPEDYFRVKEPAIENIKYAFDKYGIEVPYPQRVVHIQSNPYADS